MNATQRKFNDLLARNFSYDLKLFLFTNFLENKMEISNLFESYERFKPDDTLIDLYSTIKQLAKSTDQIPTTTIEIGKFDYSLKAWNVANKSILSELKNIYKNKRFIKIEAFNDFYNTTIKKCFYCGITEDKISQMIENKSIYTKRLFVRGRTLEIDKKNPKGNYDKENMLFCCYWCNNAKTDEFTLEEFKPIGEIIKEIWKKRF
jgi:hypothetical protein